MNNFHYPSLTRQELSAYYKSEGQFYATYNCISNYTNVSKDCQFRCVYCDAHIDECGGEPFSLDHFRPVSVFSKKFDGILSFHPFNLHLSCQKCNVLKTNDWKGCTDTIDGVTYISGKGYVDRFKYDINDYIKVDEDGLVKCTNQSGPGEYMILKLLLNRTNRVYLRRRRIVKYKATVILEMLLKKQREIIESMSYENTNIKEKQDEMNRLLNLYERFQKVNLINL